MTYDQLAHHITLYSADVDEMIFLLSDSPVSKVQQIYHETVPYDE